MLTRTERHFSNPDSRQALVGVLRGPFGKWASWTAVGLLLVLVSGYGLDHPVARYVHERMHPSRLSRRLVHIPEVVILACIVSVMVLGAWSAFVGRLTGFWRQVLLASVSLCIAMTLTTAFKIWFGRIPPMRWYYQQWHNFFAYLAGSFPSGHMTAMSAIGPYVWARSRWLMVPLVMAGLAGCYGLVMQQAHFVSDLFGGMIVGGSVGYAVLCADRRR